MIDVWDMHVRSHMHTMLTPAYDQRALELLSSVVIRVDRGVLFCCWCCRHAQVLTSTKETGEIHCKSLATYLQINLLW